ncbi:MAG: pilus assembly protein TadG-related protein [Bryobacteraceae bacterium]
MPHSLASPAVRRRRGQVLVMTSVMIVPLFGLLGLVADLGYMQYLRRSAQTAADAAAQAAIIQFHSIAAGSAYACGGSVVCQSTQTSCPASITTPSNPVENGCMYATQNGFSPSTTQTVKYTAGTGTPPTAPGVSTAYWVTFYVTQQVPQMFSAVAGNTTGVIAARATAAVAPSKDCVYALSRTAPQGLSVGGTASLTSSCGIYVNSTSSTALSTNGGGDITAPEYDISGGVSTHSPLVPTPNTGAPPASDPLAGLTTPASAPYTCDYKNFTSKNSDVTLTPGVYCGGINVGNATYTFNSGNYILVGGGLTTQSTNSHIVGNGVMFYNTFGNTDKGNFSYSPININANSTVSLTAPNSGTYAGILFFEDRNAPENYDSYGGGSTATYQGVIYAKNADITLYGNSSVTSQYTIIVANTISLIGTSGLNNNYSSLTNGSPIQRVTLVE